MQLLARAWQSLFVDTFRQAEAEAQANAHEPAVFDRETAVVLIAAALALTFQNYLGGRGRHGLLIDGLEGLGFTGAAERLAVWFTHPATAELARLSYWVATCLISYVLIPVVALRLFVGRPLREYGLSISGMAGHLWIYGAMFVFMVPAVVAVSFTESFQAKYPFYQLRPGEPLWPYFGCWELMYALQFVALEFFFRGFLVHGTKRRLGYYSVLVMTIPYTMIHFQKPALETLGAVAAGVVLGTLSLKTRSIWWGAGLHISVAYTMDLAALRQAGFW